MTREPEHCERSLSMVERGWVSFLGRGGMLGLGCLLSSLLAGCERSQSSGEPGASAVASASAAPRGSSAAPIAKVPEGLPIPPRGVESVVNPKRQPAYKGPMGTVEGSVVLVGDETPDKPKWLEPIPAECLAAREMYGKLIREGMMRSVADVFVAVTGYEGYVPAAKDEKLLEAKGCAFGTRTVGLTFGQALDIASKDMRAYVPELVGARTTAQLVATPGGQPIRLYPQRPGRFMLVDSMRIFAKADVLVVAYSTFDVTGLDGKFRIENVPAGKVKLNALLPAAMLTTEREITVQAGKTLTVELELEFDQKKYAEIEGELERQNTPPDPPDEPGKASPSGSVRPAQ